MEQCCIFYLGLQKTDSRLIITVLREKQYFPIFVNRINNFKHAFKFYAHSLAFLVSVTRCITILSGKVMHRKNPFSIFRENDPAAPYRLPSASFAFLKVILLA